MGLQPTPPSTSTLEDAGDKIKQTVIERTRISVDGKLLYVGESYPQFGKTFTVGDRIIVNGNSRDVKVNYVDLNTGQTSTPSLSFYSKIETTPDRPNVDLLKSLPSPQIPTEEIRLNLVEQPVKRFAMPRPVANIRGAATFTGGAWAITNMTQVMASLRPIAQVLNLDPNTRITILGNVAGNPSTQNWSSPSATPGVTMGQLALNRANAIRAILIAEPYCVDPAQIRIRRGNLGGIMSGNYLLR